MMRDVDLSRLRELQRAVYAMAEGNFDLRIGRSGEDDIIESIIATLNMMWEEMGETLRLYSELHVKEGNNERHLVFVLDSHFRIQGVSMDVLAVLGYDRKDLLKKSFSSLLAPNQLGVWRKIGTRIVAGEPFREQHRLLILDKAGQEHSCRCVINTFLSELEAGPFLMVGIAEESLRSLIVEDGISSGKRVSGMGYRPPNVVLRPKDRKVLRAIHDQIVKEAEQPLPSLVELAHSFGINEFKLKYGFKQLYGTSVFRFQKQERMRKAKTLVENTSLPIKTIMGMCGYVNHSHFSKDFRMAFGIAPREVRG